jgi:plastocyanin
MMRKVTPTLVVCLTAAAVTAGLLARPPSTDQSNGAARLVIAGFAFGPVTIGPGETVTVVNRDEVSHTATSTEAGFDTGPITAGAEATFVVPYRPGVYPIVCAIHPTMAGEVVVTG